jgi:hypothetical protein
VTPFVDVKILCPPYDSNNRGPTGRKCTTGHHHPATAWTVCIPRNERLLEVVGYVRVRS